METVTIPANEYQRLVDKSVLIEEILGRMGVWAVAIDQTVALNFPSGHATLTGIAESMRNDMSAVDRLHLSYND